VDGANNLVELVMLYAPARADEVDDDHADDASGPVGVVAQMPDVNDDDCGEEGAAPRDVEGLMDDD
jgi:hypothetical protein